MWEKAKQWPAAAFHLERLYCHDPAVGRRLRDALKQADDSPLTRSIRRNMHGTDAARVVSAVGRMAAPGGWPGLPLLPPGR